MLVEVYLTRFFLKHFNTGNPKNFDAEKMVEKTDTIMEY